MVIVRILKNTKYEPGVKLGVGGGSGKEGCRVWQGAVSTFKVFSEEVTFEQRLA